jgi:uncharacterized protein (DUF433 family)
MTATTRAHPAEVPSYSAQEAARILGLPVATVRNWSFGQSGRMRPAQRKRFPAVIQAADPARRLLSFANLCELHVLAAIRRHYKVSLPNVRKSLHYVRRRLNSGRPLLDRDFKTNGIALFVEEPNRLLNVTHSGQVALRGNFERDLARIQRDRGGRPIRLFPLTRSGRKLEDQPTVVALDPSVAFGRPVIASIGVRTGVVADRHRAGDSIAEMAADYGVSAAEIEEALRYESRAA